MSDETLTAHDRCDKRDCGAAGYFRAYFPVGELTFCKHHADEIDDHLRIGMGGGTRLAPLPPPASKPTGGSSRPS